MEWHTHLHNCNVIIPVSSINIVLMIGPLSNSVNSSSCVVSVGSCTNTVVVDDVAVNKVSVFHLAYLSRDEDRLQYKSSYNNV
jgi:hypothetical protein